MHKVKQVVHLVGDVAVDSHNYLNTAWMDSAPCSPINPKPCVLLQNSIILKEMHLGEDRGLGEGGAVEQQGCLRMALGWMYTGTV